MDNLLSPLVSLTIFVAVCVCLFRKAGYTLGWAVCMAIGMCIPVVELLIILYFLMIPWPVEEELARLRARAGVPTPGDA